MDQPPSVSSRPRQGSELEDRKGERRAAVVRMMAENREGLGMKMLAVIVQRYGVLPKEMWDLNSISDMGAGRGLTYNNLISKATFKSIIGNNRYSIVNLTIDRDVSHEVELPKTLRRLSIMARTYNYPLDLPENLSELSFDWCCSYDEPLVLPRKLRKLKLNCDYNQPTTLPTGIEEVSVGYLFKQNLSFPPSVRKIEWSCTHPVQLPPGVAEVKFHWEFNVPVILPASLKKITFSSIGLDVAFSHPLNFPEGLEELSWGRVRAGLILPQRLQKLTWGSNQNVNLPLSLRELILGKSAPLILPAVLQKVTFERACNGHYELPESVQEVHRSAEATFTHPTTLQHLIVKSSYSEGEIDLSNNRIHKLTIEYHRIKIKQWPQELKELAFTVDEDMRYPLRVPKGCRIVGEKLPENVIME